jgi:hypothetical protein
MLDLRYETSAKFYEAPLQVKANGGLFIIDDFGRQQVSPRDLLNRWILPLEKRIDFLTLHTGQKFSVPFDQLLIFATNIDPVNLVDEAFLRRIQFKVEVKSPDRRAFEQILRMECSDRDIPFDAHAVDLLFRDYYDHMGFPPRGCHPRDLLDHVQSLAEYEGKQAALTDDLLHRAARTYFLVMEEEYVAGIPSLTHEDVGHE